MKYYGTYGLTLPGGGASGRRSVGSSPKLSVSRARIDPSGLDTEENAESKMASRRDSKYEYLQNKAQELRTKSIDINSDLSGIQDSMEAMVNAWKVELNSASTQLSQLQSQINKVGGGATTAGS